MTKTLTTKFELEQSSSPSDFWPGRSGFNTAFANLERAVSGLPPGLLSARPAPGILGRVYTATDTTPRTVWYDDGASWVELNLVGGGGTPQTVAPGAAGAEGVSKRPARADHTHPMAALIASQIPALSTDKLTSGTLPVTRGGTGMTATNPYEFLIGDTEGDGYAFLTPDGTRSLIGAATQFRQILAGTGLAGGGNLLADRVLSVLYGTAAGTAAQGNDPRLSDARTPTGAAGGALAGTFPNPTINPALIEPAANVAGLRKIGTTALTAAAGNDSRLSDARPPTGTAGGMLQGIYPNPTIHGDFMDGNPATSSMRSLGTGSTQAAAGNDARLSDARVPKGGAGGVLQGTYPNPELNAALIDPVAATPGFRSLGGGATQAAPGNHTHPSTEVNVSGGPNISAGSIVPKASKGADGWVDVWGSMNRSPSLDTNAVVVGTLPVGYRPAALWRNRLWAPGRRTLDVAVDTDGTITAFVMTEGSATPATTPSFTLDGIRFKAA